MIVTVASGPYAPAMAAMHADAADDGAPWSEAAFETLLAQPTTIALIADTAGFILARCAADEAEVLMLAVVSAQRRRGTGRALLHAAISAARARGAARMFLEVDVANTAARRLYAAAGFLEVGTRPGYYADGRDAAVLRKELVPAVDARPG